MADSAMDKVSRERWDRAMAPRTPIWDEVDSRGAPRSLEAERWQEVGGTKAQADAEVDELHAALEARDRRIAELEAGLRRIAAGPGEWTDDPDRIARDLLSRAGGEG